MIQNQPVQPEFFFDFDTILKCLGKLNPYNTFRCCIFRVFEIVQTPPSFQLSLCTDTDNQVWKVTNFSFECDMKLFHASTVQCWKVPVTVFLLGVYPQFLCCSRQDGQKSEGTKATSAEAQRAKG